MFNNFFSLCLISVICLFQVIPAFAEDQTKDDAAILDKVKTIQFGPFELKAKDLKLSSTYDDQNRISLTGNAQLMCGQTRFSADRIEVSYKDQQDLGMSLKGNIEIENQRDQLRLFARYASLINHAQGRLLILGSRDREHVTLLRTSNQKTTQIEASRIQLLFSNLHTLRITAFNNVSIKERPPRSTDLVEIEPSAQSEFDFFDGISVTDVQIDSKKSQNRTLRSQTEAEKLQLFK
tara:strand:- start:170 stop:877 length:708 start_codon:yes stop_codon:yes gene_type:complete